MGSADRSCSANPSCAALGLSGNCCPTDDAINGDIYLNCCPTTSEMEKVDQSIISKQDIFDGKEAPKEDGVGNSAKHGLHIGKLASIIIGAVAFLMIIFCVCRCVMRSRRATDNESFDHDAYDAEISALLHSKQRAYF